MFKSRIGFNVVAVMIIGSILMLGLQNSQADHNTIHANISALSMNGFTPFFAQFTVSMGPSSSAGCLEDRYVVDWGDGSNPFVGTSAGPSNLAHLYLNPGVYTATIEYSTQVDHGDGRTLDCRISTIFDSVDVTATDQVEIPEEENTDPFLFVFEPTIFELFEKLEDLRGKALGAQAIAANLSTAEASIVDSLIGSVDKLLMEGETLVEDIVLAIEPLTFDEQLVGSVLLTHLNNILDIMDGEGMVRSRLGQARFDLNARFFDSLIDELDLIVLTVKDGDFNWEHFESVVPFGLAYKCDGSLVTISGAFSQFVNDGMIMGTNSDDIIAGSIGPDVIEALGGDDVICAGDGADIVMGGGGADIIYAGAGFDEIYGGPQNDTIYGDSGNGRLYGESGNDIIFGSIHGIRIYGGPGNDLLEGHNQRDFIYGEDGDDVIDGLAGNDVLDGGDDDDILNGGDGLDYMFGGIGDDQLNGGNGDDTLIGDAGNDMINGGPESDHLFGMDGDDQLLGGDFFPGENDFCDGGAGEDSANFCVNLVNIP